ncbi:MAG TPA: glycosyltransferase family 39 protein [Candidatus Krumholzibacteria bacterium]|nr:glycosyltransferase family 39 protein [Candidatus Krumholzibacteria bacterium]
MKRISPGLFVVLAAAAAVHLAVALQDFGTLARNGFLYDDSFYAFQIARNIAHGLGATFDGIHATNGFQPLYVAALVPLYWIAGDNPTLPIHLALVLSALLTVATAFLLHRIVARRASETAALIVAGAWAFSPIVIRQAANGLETALALFCLALSVDYYLARVRPFAAPSRRAFVTLGALLGMATLARVDLGFLALAMCLDHLLVVRARLRVGDAPVRWRGNVVAAVVACALVWAPWAIYGLVSVGSPISESGRATRYLAIAYAPFFGLASPAGLDDGPDAAFMARHLQRSLKSLKVTPAVHPLLRGTRKLSERVGVGEPVTNALGAIVLSCFFVWWWQRRRGPRAAREFDFLLLFSVMMIAAYSTYVFGVFFFLRYYYPLYFVGMIFAGLAIDDAAAWVRARSIGVRRAALVASGVYAAALLYMGYTSAFRTIRVYGFYDAARWVTTHTDPSETIGVFQGGAIGYLSQRRVVNLDGKVNTDAYQALRAGRLGEYVHEAHIDLVLDSERVLDLFLGPWSKEDRERIAHDTVFVGAEHGVHGWIGYRVTPARGFNAGSSSTPGPTRMQPGR